MLEPVLRLGFTNNYDFAHGRSLIYMGVVRNELSESLGQYNVTSQNVRCYASYTTRHAPYAKHIEALQGMIKLSFGQKVKYYLYHPLDCNCGRHSKYPLVIRDTICRGESIFKSENIEYRISCRETLWGETIACYTAYVVIVDLSRWLVVLLTGCIQLTGALIWLFDKRVCFQVGMIMWLGTNFVMYRIVLAWLRIPRQWGNWGKPMKTLRFFPRAAYGGMYFILGYLLVGGYYALIWISCQEPAILRPKVKQADIMKTSCSRS